MFVVSNDSNSILNESDNWGLTYLNSERAKYVRENCLSVKNYRKNILENQTIGYTEK